MKPFLSIVLAAGALTALAGCNSIDTAYSPLRSECPAYVGYAAFSPMIASTCGSSGAIAPAAPPPAPAPN